MGPHREQVLERDQAHPAGNGAGSVYLTFASTSTSDFVNVNWVGFS
jgi:hypothetical protein